MPNPLESLFSGYDPLEVAIEIAALWIVTWLALRFIRGTRAAGAIKGFAVLIALLAIGIRVLGEFGGGDRFGRIRFLSDQLFTLLAIGLVVVFQPEIRQALTRLGASRLFRRKRVLEGQVADHIAAAADFLSRSRFGALIVVERSVPLGSLTEGGVELDAKVSAPLLESIFWPSNPLHDLAAVVRGDRVFGAGIQLPMAEEGAVPPHLGARHRAGLGITFETDAVVVIVSEETGSIRLASRGKLSPPIPRDQVRERLLSAFAAADEGAGESEPDDGREAGRRAAKAERAGGGTA
jgi:diadenylate cyclase